MKPDRLPSDGARLVVVVGPSGAGKDSVIDAWLRRMPPGQRPHRARRVITRPADLHENHEPVGEADFDRLLQQGKFALWWPAHGLRYGVKRSELQPLAEGRWVVLNGSRAHLQDVLQLAPATHVVEITASPAVRAARLGLRGRESAAEVEERLHRRPPEVAAELRLVNDGELEEAVDRLQHWWLRITSASR